MTYSLYPPSRGERLPAGMGYLADRKLHHVTRQGRSGMLGCTGAPARAAVRRRPPPPPPYATRAPEMDAHPTCVIPLHSDDIFLFLRLFTLDAIAATA